MSRVVYLVRVIPILRGSSAQQPIYLQIADDLRNRIELGATLPTESGDAAAVGPDGQLPAVLRPGSQLPTELGLIDAYSASRNTIREAIKRLASMGLVETRQGQGTFVTRRIDPFVTVLSTDPLAPAGAEGATYLSDVNSKHRRARVSVPRSSPDADRGGRPAAPGSAEVTGRHRHQRALRRRNPMVPADVLLSHGVHQKGSHPSAQGPGHCRWTVLYIAETLGIRQVGYRDWITARSPDGNEQTFFGLAHDATVFEIFRTAFDHTGTPLRVTVTVFPPTAISSSSTSGTYQTPRTTADPASERASLRPRQARTTPAPADVHFLLGHN